MKQLEKDRNTNNNEEPGEDPLIGSRDCDCNLPLDPNDVLYNQVFDCNLPPMLAYRFFPPCNLNSNVNGE